MRRRPVIVVAGGVLALLSAGTAAAVEAASHEDPAPVETPPEAYPVESATWWLDGPVQDATDPEVGAYAFEAGFARAPARAADHLAGVVEELGDGDDPFAVLARAAQSALDSLGHNRPDPPFTHVTDAGHPAYQPDWDHDGVWGEPDDYDRDIDGVLDTAAFRYPCALPDGTVHYEVAAPSERAGECLPAGTEGVTFATGVAREIKIVNARGLVLDATVWFPGEALRRPCTEVGWTPGCTDAANIRPNLASVVFHNGLSSRQEHYSWYLMRLARAGYAVLGYDPAGQGESEGTEFDRNDSANGCSAPCMDAQDVTRWWVGDDVAFVDVGQGERRLTPLHDPAYTDEGGDNVRSPWPARLNPARMAVSGNSMGASSTVAYLDAATSGQGYDGTPVPRIAAAIPLSIPGETRITAPVPVMMMSGDMDGLPLVAPALAGQGWADDAERMYATLRETSRTAVAVVIIEGGIHTDHINQPYIGATTWGHTVTNRYAVPWLDCHVRSQRSACDALTSTMESSVEHLSRAYASQLDLDGTGPAANVCLRQPDRASLGHRPDRFAAALQGHHAGCLE